MVWKWWNGYCKINFAKFITLSSAYEKYVFICYSNQNFFIYYNDLCDLVSLCWQKIMPSDEKDKVRAKKRQYQRSHRARLKVEADASKLIAPSEVTAKKEEAQAKNREYQQERYAALPNHKEEFQEKNREYQRSHRAHLKATANASKLIASTKITNTRMDDKGNSCKRKWDVASQVDNIGILLWFLLSTFLFLLFFFVFGLHSQLLPLFIFAKIVLSNIFESFRSRH